MSNSFNRHADVPFQLEIEGQQIAVNFRPGVPGSSQGTIEWNIPAPAPTRKDSNGIGVYAGMVFVLDTKPIKVGGDRRFNPNRTNLVLPEDGKVYTADSTADKDLHTGDKIGEDALVVGAIYEREKKANDEELTTSLVISDIDPETPYYIAAFPVDDQFRYYTKGVRAYSDTFGVNPPIATPATQRISFDRRGDGFLSFRSSSRAGFPYHRGFIRPGIHSQTHLGAYYGPYGYSNPHEGNGVLPSDATGLTAGKLYQFDIEINPSFPFMDEKRTVNVTIDGAKAPIYRDLIIEINAQLAQADNPPKSPVHPHKGQFVWDQDEQKVFKWDGEEHIDQKAFVQDEDPNLSDPSGYWYDTKNEQLKKGDGTDWNDVSTIVYSHDPTQLEGCDHYWINLDQEQAWQWDTNVWCKLPKTYVQEDDPSKVEKPQCPVYWFDTDDEELLVWDPEECDWEQTHAIMWDVDPQDLDDGTLWFDETNELLKQYDQSTQQFEIVNENDDGTQRQVLVQKKEPATSRLANGTFWYDVKNEKLFRWKDADGEFEEQDVIVWPEDPTDLESCDLWWDTENDELNKWDSVNSTWVQVESFTQSDQDPLESPTLDIDTAWYDTDKEKLVVWDGANWFDVSFIEFDSDPSNPSTDTVWFDGDQTFKVWNGSEWEQIDPIISEFDPADIDGIDQDEIKHGVLWFDTNDEILFYWDATESEWEPVSFTDEKIEPEVGDQYYNTRHKMLLEWDGNKWTEGTPLATVDFDDGGRLMFETSFTGGNACIQILVPHDAKAGMATSFRTATGKADYNENSGDWFLAGSIHHHFFNHHGAFTGTPTGKTDVTADTFLFDYLQPNARVQPQVYGNEGVHPTPMYQQPGVGDDQSPDEIRALMQSIKSEFGHPIVDVELTDFQLEECIRRSLHEYRKRSSNAYKRGFFFLDIVPRQQSYKLTDKNVGFHRIVTITSAHRFTSAFLSTAHGAGAYGQVIMQHLYNMGTYDLTSFHLISQYIEQLEHLFATRLRFHWDEQSRTLHFHHSFVYPEVVLLDVAVERTEQELMTDRYSRNWVEQYAFADAMDVLSQIRGKYASLPGAGGGVTLNANELQTRASEKKESLILELEDYIADTPEEWGQHSTIIIG